MIDLSDTTFIIPLRIDSIERLENIKVVIDFIYSFFDTKIIVLEADKQCSGIIPTILNERVEYQFVLDNDPIFHRTKYINTLVKSVFSKNVAIWDADVVVHPKQIELAVSALRDNRQDFVFPYSGEYLDTGAFHRINFLNIRNIQYLFNNRDSMLLPYTSTACGGGFFARLFDYQECGGENENFYGWGQEDGERVKRWQILDKRVTRVNGPMFHLYHPRGTNSGYLSEHHRQAQIAEFYRISGLSKDALLSEIAGWKASRTNV